MLEWKRGQVLEINGPQSIKLMDCETDQARVCFLAGPIDRDVLAKRHPDLKNSGFAHVLTVGKLSGLDRFEIAPGLVIRKASSAEVCTLSEFLRLYPPDRHPFGAPGRNPYETNVRKSGNGRSACELPQSEWRYHVVEYEKDVDLLASVSVMTRTRLRFGLKVTQRDSPNPILNKPSPEMTSDASRQCWKQMGMDDSPLLVLDESDLQDLRDAYKHVDLVGRRNESEAVQNAVRSFLNLDGIPNTSPLRFLGYVAILESLITHAPLPSDPYDSLTRQVKKKMGLIGNRAKLPIPYELFDLGVATDKVWGKLYAYRSKIAHGGAVFSRELPSEFSCLKDASTALQFIERAVRSVIRQSAEEPELMADLHQC